MEELKLVTAISIEINSVLSIFSLKDLDGHLNWILIILDNSSLNFIFIVSNFKFESTLFKVTSDLIECLSWVLGCEELGVLVHYFHVFLNFSLWFYEVVFALFSLTFLVISMRCYSLSILSSGCNCTTGSFLLSLLGFLFESLLLIFLVNHIFSLSELLLDFF